MTIGHINTKHSAQSSPAISRSTRTVSVHLLNTTPDRVAPFFSVHTGLAVLWFILTFHVAPAHSSLHRRSLSWLPSTDKLHLHFVSSIKTEDLTSWGLGTPHFSLIKMNESESLSGDQESKQSPQHTRDISLFFVGIPQWQLDWGKTRQKTWWCNYNCVDILHGYT